MQRATMLTPAPSSTLGGASQTFTWTNTGAANYQIWAGSKLGGYEYGSPGIIAAGVTSYTFTTLPVDGTPVCIRLWSLFGSTWIYNDYIYRAFGGPVWTSARFIGSSTLTFSRAPLRPDQSFGFTQAIQETTGGVRVAYHSYVANDLIDLHPRMTGAEMAQFKAFFTDVARGMAYQFIYVDALGTPAIVRFTSSRRPPIIEKAYNAFETTVTLRVQ